MYLSNINTGTNFEVTFDDGLELTCVYEGKIDHMSFYVQCYDIFSNIETFVGQIPMFKFYVQEKYYTFTGEILGRTAGKYSMVDTVDVIIRTPIKEGTDRKEFRIETNMKVRIFDYSDDRQNRHAGDWICDAQSSDISKRGIRLFCDHKLIAPEDNLYTLEFKLTKDGSYTVPAKLVRNQPNTATRSYNYDLGFIFDFSNDAEKQDKLLMDLLYAKINKVI